MAIKGGKITHAEKILFPKSGITKGDLMHYYENISDHILPYLKDRPLTLHRFPNGISKNGFYQKNTSDYFPDWIRTLKVRKKKGWVNHVICDSLDTLLYLINHDTITIHIALSKVDKLDYPDKLIFDLDPSDTHFNLVVESAFILKDFLENDMELKTYPMITGSKGLHVVIPLLRNENFEEVHDFAKSVARYLSLKHPQAFTAAIRKDKRQAKLFLDYLRNSCAQTAVCPFAVRALEGAPVATPVGWHELGTNIESSQSFDIHTISQRLSTIENPWKSFYMHCKALGDAKKKLEQLIEI
jgi:bifunctional non-homologous end joining protein LigD